MQLNASEIQQITGRQGVLSLLDKVEKTDGNSLQATCCVSISEEFFRGHFPKNPVMPGVLIIEALIQAAEILLRDQSMKLSKIKKARFREMVKPGDCLSIEINRKTDRVFKAEAKLKDKLACSAELIFA